MLVFKKPGKAPYRIKFDYSKSKHGAYAEHVAEVFRHWVITAPVDQKRKNSDYIASRFQTLTHSAFKELGDMFMSTGKKSLPDNLVINYVT